MADTHASEKPQLPWFNDAVVLGFSAAVLAASAASRRGCTQPTSCRSSRSQSRCRAGLEGNGVSVAALPSVFIPGSAHQHCALRARCCLQVAADAEILAQAAIHYSLAAADAAATVAAVAGHLPEVPQQLAELLGPPLPAHAVESGSAVNFAWSSISEFFFDPRLQWDENGNVLRDPRGDPLPDNLWTQFVACQATLIKRLDQGIHGLGVPQSFGLAVACYTIGIRTALYPFVKGQLETTAKIQVLAPRVNELKEKYKDDEERLQQEVGLLYMDLQIDPLGAIVPLLFQLPVFWGLYRAIRRLGIVQYEPLREGFLWIPSLYGPNFQPDPSFDWLLKWQGPLIELHPTIGWTDFGLYAVLPLSVCLAYRQILSEATSDANSPKLLVALPFLLAFITSELPQALGIYIATNIVSSVALTAYTKNQISAKIPGYDEFVKTGKWPPGVDPEKVLAQAFGVKRLTDAGVDGNDNPASIPEAVFAGRADFIPELIRNGRNIDEYDDRGIPATAYTLALDNTDLLERLLDLGASPVIRDKRGNSLLHYAAGYGRAQFLPTLLEKETVTILNTANEDGQTPLDVARINLSQEKVADDVRKVIAILVEKGAEGKATTQADEARFEEVRERKKKEEALNAARSALKALALASKPAEPTAAAPHGAHFEVEGALVAAAGPGATSEEEQPSLLQQSLTRVKSLSIDDIKDRLGGSLSEEQLKKVTERLSKMSPEQLAAYAAGLPSVQEAASNDTAVNAVEPEATKEQKQESVIVD